MNCRAIIFTLLVFAGCVKEAGEDAGNVPEKEGSAIVEEGPHIVFSGTAEPVGGKLSLDGPDVVWSEGDKITVTDAAGRRSLYRATAGGTETTFEYVSGPGPVEAPYTAWYPAEIADGYIPVSQPFAEGGITCIPMKAVSSSTEFSFRNLTGLVKVRLHGPHPDICAVSLTAEKGIGGFFDTSVEPGQPSQVSGPSTVQITPSSPVDITEGADFCFAVAQGSYASLCLAVLDAGGNLAYYSGGGVEVKRSAITPVQDIEVLNMGNGDGLVHNLSASGTANCYIPAGKNDYKFYAASMGNHGSATVDFSPVSAEILWSESSGTGAFDAIRPVVLYDNHIYFRKCRMTGETFHPGNAVVAVRDASGRILWSWHLWMPEQTASNGAQISSRYAHSAGTVMTYGLGETKDDRNGGFFYQWGRKDPFPGDYRSREAFPEAVEVSSVTGTIKYSVSNPMQFIYGNDASCYDWSYDIQANGSWGASGLKSLYDPCPQGWHVPDGAGHGISGISRGATPIVLEGLWPVAFGTGIGFCGKNADNSLYWNADRKGVLLPASVAGAESWFAAGGWLDPEDGKLVERGWTGGCWTRGAEKAAPGVAAAAYCFTYGAGGRVNPAGMSNKAAGRNVRCVAD